MRLSLWIGALLAFMGGAWPAPRQDPKAAVIIPPPGQPEFLYVTNRGASNDVTVWTNYTSVSGATMVKQITDPSLKSPYGIIADPARRVLYVSNSGASPGTITIISGDTLTVAGTIPVPDSQLLKGMVMSDDGNFLFVAGSSISLSAAAIFRVDPVGMTAGLVASDNGGNAAEDCAVIPASVAGGSGNGPGRLYYSVPSPGPGFIGIHYFIGSGPARFTMQSTPDNTTNIATPTRMSRSPDGTIVLAAVTTSSLATLRLLRLDAVANTSAQTAVTAGATGPWFTVDVSFRPEATNRAYVLGNRGLGTIDIYEVDSNGVALPNPATPSITPLSGVVNNPLTLLHHVDPAGNDLVLDGPSTATGGDVYFGVYDVSTTPAGTGTFIADGAGSPGVGEGPTSFAFMAMPLGPVVGRTLPKGALDLPGTTLIVEGSNFQPGAVVELGTGLGSAPVPTTYVNPNTLLADVSGSGGTLYNVIVRNPDLQSSKLATYFDSIVPPGSRPAFTVPLPSLGQGYEIHSFPQYGKISDLQQALAAQFGPYDPVFYRVFFWNVDHYEELNTLSDATDPDDLCGRAFFVLARFGGSLTVSTPDVRANTPGLLRVVPLRPGWNLFSQPYLNGANTILWSDVQLSLTPDLANPVPAQGSASLSPLPYDYVNNAYVNVTSLIGGHGYWLFNYSPNTVYLMFNLTFVNIATYVGPQVTIPLAAGDPGPPAPPSATMSGGGSSGGGGGGCGLLGPELLLLALGGFAFHRLRDRRTLRA